MLLRYCDTLPTHTRPPPHLLPVQPIDCVEIGSRQWACGSIVRVKVLGVLGLIDAGETDWKLIVISAEDPLAPLLSGLDDVDVHMPGLVDALRTWLRLYKLPVVNTFIRDGEALDAGVAKAIIEETHSHWLRLVEGRGSADHAGGGAGGGVSAIAAAGLQRVQSRTALSAMMGAGGEL